MSDSELYTGKDSDQNKDYLDVDQECGNTNVDDSHHSVQFVLDERENTYLNVPIINIETHDEVTIKNSGDITFKNEDIIRPTSFPSNRQNAGLLFRTFEEHTGGLPKSATKDTKNTLFFNDGVRRIDLILVYEGDRSNMTGASDSEAINADYRNTFQENLIREGLELEIEDEKQSFDGNTAFIKIHCPLNVLEKYARLMHLKQPAKRQTCTNELLQQEKNWFTSLFQVFRLKSALIPDDPSLNTSVTKHGNQDKLYIKDREKFFTSAQRSQIVWQILLRTRFSAENNIGIRKLMNYGTYTTAFPLHEGKHNMDTDLGFMYDRRILFLSWAKASVWYKYQPLGLIRKYFGDKIALYFAWLGFYTNMLILPSIVGLCFFIYGVVTMDSDDNTPSKEICDPNLAGNITLCPLCESTCKYQKLGDTCLFSNITYLSDNKSTVYFSIFMSFWAVTFLELWKRKQAVLRWQWDLYKYNADEETRPEYEISSRAYKINPVTRSREPFVPTSQKVIKLIISITVVTLMICVVLAFVVITILLRMLMYTYISDSEYNIVRSHAKLVTTTLAALINLLTILFLTKIYHYLAIWLTNVENPRTTRQYERSFILKIFLFEFMNYYSSLIYIAFFKGRFFTYPGNSKSNENYLQMLKGDVCDPAGCLSELCIQLAIIMVGKQFFANILEILYPAVRNWWRSRIFLTKKRSKIHELKHWEENYALQDPGNLALFEEYLEMVIQYGFVTLFVAAFPLAPLFALLNNICEIRLDAYKMLVQSRRPIAETVENIGTWYGILQGLTYCAVAFNAFVIAYTSDFIPRFIYQHFYSKNNDLVGYINSSLSVFNTTHFEMSENSLGKNFVSEPQLCQYRGYRHGPEDDKAYELSEQYWIIFAARLVFIVIFEHFVFIVSEMISFIIPDVPYLVGRQIQLEELLKRENESWELRTKDANNTYMDDYDKFLSDIRTAQDSDKFEEVIERNAWLRRISRHMSTVSLGSTKKSANEHVTNEN